MDWEGDYMEQMVSPTAPWEKDFVEAGAVLEHDRWARWQKYMFSKGHKDHEFFMIPIKLWERWQRQIDTPYAELSDEEQESDRKETRNYLSLIRSTVEAAKKEGYEQGRMKCLEQHHGEELKEAVRKALEGLLGEMPKKVDEDGDPDAEIDRDYIMGKQKGWNTAITQVTALIRSKIVE
jgi:hypothetical protein